MIRLWTISVLLLAGVSVGRAQQGPRLVANAGDPLDGRRGGDGKAFHLDSVLLAEQRKLRIALPASYARSSPTRRYPVVLLLDGESSFGPTTAVADALAWHGQIPECILVAIENTDRRRDLTPPGLSVSGSSVTEGGDRFLDFIEQELLPAVDQQFRGAAPRVLIGHSSGGILATYAAATRSTYCCVVALDTPVHLGQNWLAAKLTARAKNAAGPLRYASYEALFGWSDATWQALTAVAPSTWQLHRELLVRESHESMPMLGCYLGLRVVFGDYSMLAAPKAPTTSILPYYAVVSQSLGTAVPPPQRLLDAVVEDLLMEGRGSAAREAYDQRVVAYGAPSDAEDLVQQIASAERMPPPSETVEALLATPFPTPAAASAFLGEWLGNVWMNEDELLSGQPNSRLRIAVQDGAVVGETISESPDGHLVQKWTHLQITPEGMTFGYQNGMRPRGVLLHEGRLENGSLSGVIRFAGVRFTPPEGMGEIHFAYRKVANANPQVPSPAATAYLNGVLDIIQQGSIKLDTDWAKVRQTALESAGAAVTTADTHAAIREAIASLGDRHSFFIAPAEAKLLAAGRSRASTGLLVLHPDAIVAQVMPDSPAARARIRVGDRILAVGGLTMRELPRREFQRLMDNGMRPDGSTLPLELTVQWRSDEPRLLHLELADFDSNRAPTGRRLEGDIGYLELPGLGGGPLADTYADTLQAIQKEIDAQPVSGWIVDLRRNTGGNMWPMLAGIGPLVGEGRVGGFASSRGVSEWTYENGVAAVAGNAACTVNAPYVPTRSQPPVAVLTSGLTASSGEAVLVAFRGRPDCRSFGAPTRGVPTANQTVPLEDGAMLVVTVCLDADRTGKTYDDSIGPDEVVALDWTTFGTTEDPVLLAALRWLHEQTRKQGR